MNQSTLLDTHGRNKRIAEKQKIILNFLRDEIWTDVSVIQQLLNFSTVQAAYQTLQKLERDQLIKKTKIQILQNRPITIWGITETGLHYSFSLDEPLQTRRIFEPSKVKPITMQHKLDLQLARVKAEKNGWTNWITGELLGKKIKCSKYPDAISTNTKGERIAIELERTIKSRKRYTQILVSHLIQRKKGDWDKIYYLSPDEGLSKRIERAYKSLPTASHKGEKFKVTDAHLSPFHFYSFKNNNWL